MDLELTARRGWLELTPMPEATADLWDAFVSGNNTLVALALEDQGYDFRDADGYAFEDALHFRALLEPDALAGAMLRIWVKSGSGRRVIVMR